MNAQGLYQKLDQDFELNKLSDDWKEMDFNEYISDNFKTRYMGLVLDNSKEINKVCTAVFPEEKILNKILDSGEKDVLLFTHHPMVWDIMAKEIFKNIREEHLKKLKENRISLYTLHVPLDKDGQYSTTENFAKVIGVAKKDEFCEYFGVKVGVIGYTEYRKVTELVEKIERTIGHKVKLWNYGAREIKNQTVALVAGGGNSAETIKELAGKGSNTFITGITKPNKNYLPSLEAHNSAKENKINIIGATHYSTEKFACIAMVEYFKKLNLPAEFVEGEPDLNDLE